jgi:hypothetical protein
VIVKRVEAERRVSSIKRAPKWKKWFLLSADGTKNLGGYQTKREAAARERAVQYFKHRKKNPIDNPIDIVEWEEMVQTMGHEEARSELRHLRRMLPKVRREGTIRQEQGMETMIDVLQRKVGNLSAENPGRKKLYIYPNKSSIKAAQRGLRAREKAPKSKKGGLDAMQAADQGIGSGVLRARDIIAGKRINAYQVKAFFDRHQGNYLNAVAKGLKPEESKAIQAWLIWGGGPLYSQVKRAVERDKKGLAPLKKDVTKPKKTPTPNARPFLDRTHDWDEVLIQKGSKRRTRGEIRDYYLENEGKIWPYLKGQTVMVILGVGKNDFVLRRKAPDGTYIKLTKLKGIEDPHSFEYWINRRVIEFHPVIDGKTTPLIWIDVDPYRTNSKAMNRRMQRRIRENIPLMKSILRKEFKASPVQVWRSGKQDGGWHVEGNLPRAMDADRARVRLRSVLDEAFKEDKHFVTTIAKPDQIRLDTTLLKSTGSLRAPYSYTVDGEQKLPVNAHENPIMMNPPLAGADIARFKSAASVGPSQVQRFVEIFGPDIAGGGVGRVVYKVDGDDGMTVIKVDREVPPEQTSGEIECLLTLGKHPLAPKLIDYDDENYRWIQMEAVEPFDRSTIQVGAKYYRAFENQTEISWPSFESLLKGNRVLLSAQNKKAIMDKLGTSEKSKRFLRKLFKVMRNCDLMIHEVSIFENWGLNANGKLKLLDLGQ